MQINAYAYIYKRENDIVTSFLSNCCILKIHRRWIHVFKVLLLLICEDLFWWPSCFSQWEIPSETVKILQSSCHSSLSIWTWTLPCRQQSPASFAWCQDPERMLQLRCRHQLDPETVNFVLDTLVLTFCHFGTNFLSVSFFLK